MYTVAEQFKFIRREMQKAEKLSPEIYMDTALDVLAEAGTALPLNPGDQVSVTGNAARFKSILIRMLEDRDGDPPLSCRLRSLADLVGQYQKKRYELDKLNILAEVVCRLSRSKPKPKIRKHHGRKPTDLSSQDMLRIRHLRRCGWPVLKLASQFHIGSRRVKTIICCKDVKDGGD